MAGESVIHTLAEMARDGAWTARQLASRRTAWGLADPREYVQRFRVRLHPTAWAHRTIEATVMRPNTRGVALLREHGITPQEIRPQELEHSLGLAELRFRCGTRQDDYLAQDGIGRLHRRLRARGGGGLGEQLADGTMRTPAGVILLEYDHGHYTARQVREKLLTQQARPWWHGERILGAIWGAPTPNRATWLMDRGAEHVVVLQPDTWMR